MKFTSKFKKNEISVHNKTIYTENKSLFSDKCEGVMDPYTRADSFKPGNGLSSSSTRPNNDHQSQEKLSCRTNYAANTPFVKISGKYLFLYWLPKGV